MTVKYLLYLDSFTFAYRFIPSIDDPAVGTVSIGGFTRGLTTMKAILRNHYRVTKLRSPNLVQSNKCWVSCRGKLTEFEESITKLGKGGVIAESVRGFGNLVR